MPHSDSLYKRHSGWLKARPAESTGEDSHLFSWVYTPTSSQSQSTGFVLCAPLGHEYIHSHRALRHFAEMLARHGYPCTRFDYTGVGNSTGSQANNFFERCVDDIEAAAAHLQKACALEHIVFVGVGFAANLAAMAVEKWPQTCSLVLWEPFVSARHYKRKVEALSLVSEFTSQAEEGAWESAGFAYQKHWFEDISQYDLSARALPNVTRLILIESDESKTRNTQWTDTLASKIAAHRISRPDFSKMFCEPHKTSVPFDVMGEVVAIFTAKASNPSEGVPHSVKLTPSLAQPGYLEEVYNSSEGVFGVLTKPVNMNDAKPLVILSNAGSVHHVGPNQSYVQLARHLAKHGWSSLRYDARNLGDSCTGCPENENFPYSPQNQADLDQLVEHFSQTYPSCILAGVCSGAYVSFYVGLGRGSRGVSKLILINPLTFEWVDGMSLDVPSPMLQSKEANYYRSALRDRSRWAKLLKGKVNFKAIAYFAVTYSYQKVCHFFHDIGLSLGWAKPNLLQSQISILVKHKLPVSFVFSDSDPGYKLLTDSAGVVASKAIQSGKMQVTFVDHADHTFSLKQMRSKFYDQFLSQLTS